MTLVVPTGKNEGDVWDLARRVAVFELSTAVASCQVTVIPCEVGGAFSVMSFGQVTTGGVTSTEKTIVMYNYIYMLI